ncbi:embryo-specific protein ATS3A-like isoform X2 [Punica granatum]|uniref:Embryo-specific protein ATS3A-like isoform X2 n=1 Tax=Punica granatum TaxID=22663 RepID=A0A6P8CT70_PUNGR|nr:embryo-specific protein ATS3A-like isoform X2 [Punica granatum]
MGSMKISKKAWLFVSCVALLILLAGGETISSEEKGRCTYIITVQTSCTNGAETSSPVSLRFGDANSTDILIRRLNTKHAKQLDPLQPDHHRPLEDDADPIPVKLFQACSVDEFQVASGCVESPICYLYLKLVGADDWRPGSARVDVIERAGLSSQQFRFRRFLPRRAWHGSDLCGGELTPFGVKRQGKEAVKKLVI